MNSPDTIRLTLMHLDADRWQAELRCEGVSPRAAVRLVLRPEHGSQDVPFGRWSVDAQGRLATMDLRSAVIFRDFEVEVLAVCEETGRESNPVCLLVPSFADRTCAAGA